MGPVSTSISFAYPNFLQITSISSRSGSLSGRPLELWNLNTQVRIPVVLRSLRLLTIDIPLKFVQLKGNNGAPSAVPYAAEKTGIDFGKS